MERLFKVFKGRNTPSSGLSLWKLAPWATAWAVAQALGPAIARGGEATARATSAEAVVSEAPVENSERRGNSASRSSERLREGTRLTEVVGTFQTIGADGITFSPRGSKESYRVLENLALERIGRTLDESRGTRLWVVSGLITEYRGANYLLVSKAVMQADEPAAER